MANCLKLHCVRSLLCRANNETPRERFFTFDVALHLEFRFLLGLSTPGLYILDAMGAPPNTTLSWKRWNLAHATPQYAHVRFPSGSETTVPLSDVAPAGWAASGYSHDADLGPALDTVCHQSRSFRCCPIVPPKEAKASLTTSRRTVMIKTPVTLRAKYVRVKPVLNLVLLTSFSRSSSQRTSVEIWSCPLLVICF